MTYTKHLRTIGHALRFSINYYDFIKMVPASTMKKVVIFDYVHEPYDYFEFTRFSQKYSPNIPNSIIPTTLLLTRTIKKLRLYLIKGIP